MATAAVLFLVALMSWVTLVCSQKVSRWPNIVVAVGFFGYYKLAALVGWYPTSRTPGIMLNEAWGLVAALGVVWYAWQRPQVSSVAATTH